MIGYFFQSRRGVVQIVPLNGRWSVIYNEEDLGSYHHPAAAADDVAGGHTFTPSNGVDLGEAGIPYDLSEWSQFNVR